MSTRLSELMDCFQGVVPTGIATCSLDGRPNVTFLSYVKYLDERHVALSCQFFNKTKRNIAENPVAAIWLMHPVTLEAHRVVIRFLHSEFKGPLFDEMALRIDVIASHTGMSGVFKLLSADIYEVLEIEPVEGHVLPDAEAAEALAAPPVAFRAKGTRGELAALQALSDRISRAECLERLIEALLDSTTELFEVQHAMVLLYDETRARLYTLDSRGYGRGGSGAEVGLGEGLIGAVARSRKPLRVSHAGSDLRYGRAIRRGVEGSKEADKLSREIPLPGLHDAQSQLVLPLVAREKLVGVLALESRDPLKFSDWHEAFLNVAANQAALAIANLQEQEEPEDARPAGESQRLKPLAGRKRAFTFYPQDDAVFVDGQYLIRNLPGRILWKILREFVSGKRHEFTNRELRMDNALGLPPLKDNLESRLILLRKRLEEKCPDVRMVPVRRGAFALESDSELTLSESAQP